MLAARARAAGTAWRSGLPALTGGAARALCVPSHHIHPEMPDKWRRLTYTDLEVWDTAELKQLESQMLEMEKSLAALRATAVEENRPIIKKNRTFDSNRRGSMVIDAP